MSRDSSNGNVILRTTDGVVCRLKGGKKFQTHAYSWRYKVNNRRRWAGTTESAEKMASQAVQDLAELGLDRSSLKKIARARIVEVEIPWIKESVGWEFRIFPWEYVLSAATKHVKHNRRLTVVRRLNTGTDRAFERPPTPKFAILKSAPSVFDTQFSFEQEFHLLSSCFDVDSPRILDPVIEELPDRIKELAPDVLHVTAIDSHFGRMTLGKETYESYANVDEESKNRDALLFNSNLDGNAEFSEVGSIELAQALNAAKQKPRLIGFNCWNTATRFAPVAIANGAFAALAFDSSFDDRLAELMFATFYRELLASDWDYMVAFIHALEAMREHPKQLMGTGVVLWTANSLIDSDVTGSDRAQSVSKSLEVETPSQELFLSTGDGGINREMVMARVQVLDRLNYSLLHNNRNLFHEFTLRKPKSGRIRDVRVEVKLCVGADSYPYQTSVDLEESLTDLRDRIRLPLTSELARSVDENLRTSVFVDISWQGHSLYRETQRTTLAPIDQWRDTDDDRRWLPSFVLPRDPAVQDIIYRAQKYLMCLADDPTKGFDGYQSIDMDYADDPYVGVDQQVQAIWAALTLEQPINYVNPPPTYSDTSQRLRTPGEVLKSGRGTCIDLTLLLAACLEYVEIYPAIFLLEGHAFPAYWRDWDTYSEFIELKRAPNPEQPTSFEGFAFDDPWVFGPDNYLELRNCVLDGLLVPLESVWLTNYSSFAEAIEEGHKNLASKEYFHSMCDVTLARKNDVTPLPRQYSS